MTDEKTLHGVHAKDFMEVPRLKPGDDGYSDVERMLQLVNAGAMGRRDFDLLIMPTVNPDVPVSNRDRNIAAHGLTSAGTFFTHRYDSSKKDLRERLQAHKLRALTVRDLVRAHEKAKRPSIVEVYCKGYVLPFVWYMGMDKRPQEDWLEDLDKYCNTPRVLSFDGN